MCIVKYIQTKNLVFKCVICSSVCMINNVHHTIPLIRASDHLLIFQTQSYITLQSQLESIQVKTVQWPKPLPSLGHHVAEASSHNFCTAAAEFLGTSPLWIANDPTEFPGHPFHGELVQLLCLKLYSSAETSSKLYRPCHYLTYVAPSKDYAHEFTGW